MELINAFSASTMDTYNSGSGLSHHAGARTGVDAVDASIRIDERVRLIKSTHVKTVDTRVSNRVPHMNGPPAADARPPNGYGGCPLIGPPPAHGAPNDPGGGYVGESYHGSING